MFLSKCFSDSSENMMYIIKHSASVDVYAFSEMRFCTVSEWFWFNICTFVIVSICVLAVIITNTCLQLMLGHRLACWSSFIVVSQNSELYTISSVGWENRSLWDNSLQNKAKYVFLLMSTASWLYSSVQFCKDFPCYGYW